MKDFFLNIYDWLSARKWLAGTILGILVVLCGILVTRMDYQEDISAFLPQDEMGAKYQSVYRKLGGQDRVAVFFSVKDTLLAEDEAGDIMDAMDCFAGKWADTDTAGIVSDLQVCTDQAQVLDVLGFISENYPYFITEQDIARADSLLAEPGFIASRLASDKASLASLSSAVTSRYLRSDPLGLFSPVLERMRGLNPSESGNIQDGYIFTADGHTGVAFLSSPFGESESGRNAELVTMIDRAVSMTEDECPGVDISFTGGPVVAVENASQIKKDSILAVSLALLLICVILFLSYRRFADVFWIAVSIICGALFSLGLIAVFKSTISIIVLGIGAMILGIAVNYPLHYIDHLKYEPDKRKALREQVNPLLVGNITTVGAFLALLLVKADALHDFGLVGALMLVGTIIFVLIFLPVLATGRSEKATNTIRLDFDRHINAGPLMRKAAFAAFLILTAIFLVCSRRISFDSDMHHINYMTPEQSRGFEILSSLGGEGGALDNIYAVAEAPEAEEALRKAEQFGYSAVCDFVPSRRQQEIRLGAWKDFLDRHPDLEGELARGAAAEGFAKTAFDPFNALLHSDFAPQDIDWFEPVASTLGQSMLLHGEDGHTVVGYVKVPQEQAAQTKESIMTDAPEGCFCFDSSDVSSRLVSLLSEDFDNVGWICSLIVFFFLWLSFGSLELSIMSFLPLAVGWVWILGIMQLTGLQFNIVNIILATFIFGMGDDYTIFITEGLMYEHACGKKILTSYKNCVALSALIMLIGIGALIVARHPAMRSLAEVTMVGMFAVVVMAYYLPPLVFRRLTRKKGAVREVPVTIGRLMCSAGAMTFFLLACLFITPVVLISNALLPNTEKRRLRYHKFLQGLSRFIINHVPGTRFSWSNPHGEDFSRPAIFISNHQSHLDVMAVMMLTPKVVILTNDWVWNNFFYGALIHRAEFYPASDGMEANMPRLRDLVARGYSVLVYPEGTRSGDCSIMRFHRGAFTMARELGIDVLPLYIHGFGYALPKKDFMLRKTGMYLEVGRRVSLDEMQALTPDGWDERAVTRHFHHLYLDEYARIRRERETASYNAQWVKYQYLYKGIDAARECRSVLKKSVYDEIDGGYAGQDKVEIHDAGYGCYALLLALSRPDLDITAYEQDEEKHLTATRCQRIPDNLHYVLGK